MVKTFNTKIIFKRTLSNQEQFAFWSNAISTIKKVAVSSSGEFHQDMDWNIDYTECDLNEYEAKKRFANFLDKQSDFIKDFSFYSKS